MLRGRTGANCGMTAGKRPGARLELCPVATAMRSVPLWMVRGDEFPCMNVPATPARMHITDNHPALAMRYLKQHKCAGNGPFQTIDC
jgi:hypothetical protein